MKERELNLTPDSPRLPATPHISPLQHVFVRAPGSPCSVFLSSLLFHYRRCSYSRTVVSLRLSILYPKSTLFLGNENGHKH